MALNVYQEDYGWVVDLYHHEFGIYVWGRTPALLRCLFSKMPATLPENRNLVVRAIDAALHAEAGIRQIAWWPEDFAVG